ncbi:DUF1996 domain-containing protein [Crossiella sp. CA-258035]|uniref:DUF1996 domain-containing protein n=1 Tax=Crossiella sp. CA-258035 TaxID=2981138 RepID=UPI0024BC5DDB|nr:DUF1996 domain-containing protein [Crossiella sp. CA-258035]WHT15634.1 DUF1996 domain-containing protein [Crossiella sp. CA-258035]
MALHRLPSRRAAFLAAFITMTLLAGVVAVITSSVQPGSALADGQGPEDQYVDIRTVRPNVRTPRGENDATRGTFTVDCGRNENGHFNPDNFIAQPGVRNGAEHLHDYVGNLSTDADSTNESLKRAGTTCKNGDKSTYFWPVVRIDRGDDVQNPKGQRGGTGGPQVKKDVVSCPDVASKLPDVPDETQPEVEKRLDELDAQLEEAIERLRGVDPANEEQVRKEVIEPLTQLRAVVIEVIRQVVSQSGQQPETAGLERCEVKQDNAEVFESPKASLLDADGNNELPGNAGEIQRPEVVDLSFRGSPTGKVTAMPRFLRILYGDAKVSTNGTKNARASWTCTGFENRLINKYPICPQGSKVKRVHDFPSCWDGRNIDSQNHRDHIQFPDANSGRCPRGTRAVPQLRISLTYNIPLDIQQQRRYAVDSFPEEAHNPFSDHDDFANVMSQSIMNRVVNCINKNKRCRE